MIQSTASLTSSLLNLSKYICFVKYYFANPYASWERGLSEHTNGLLRQYFPKQMYFDKLSKEEVREAVD